MAHVVFLKGLNVGGHRTFRPAALARQLRHLGAVNVGAAGTFVIRSHATAAQIRAEVARRLPFDCAIAICNARSIAKLVAASPFAGVRSSPRLVHFVSMLSKPARRAPRIPVAMPSERRWTVRVLERRGRILIGVHRREMRAIGALAGLDELFGAPVTTRSWNTISRVHRILEA